jgi:hypothetical protein
VRTVHQDLEGILGPEFRKPPPRVPHASEVMTSTGLAFLQEYFFLILFRSVFASLGVPRERLGLYTELNFCIKGTITAADNLFDDQAKSLLPLSDRAGPRFMSILQLMAFERLSRRVLDRGQEAAALITADRDRIQRGLLDRMAEIGALEGSEEGGVSEVLSPDDMVDAVHRVRGGALFALAFVAPSVLERGETAKKMTRAESAIARLGTAFQIVDDLTDFELDLARRSHNLLVAQIEHAGSREERTELERARAEAATAGGVTPGIVEGPFKRSARVVLGRAYEESHAALAGLAELGFWLEPELAEEVVHAIVGLDGTRRMGALARPE